MKSTLFFSLSQKKVKIMPDKTNAARAQFRVDEPSLSEQESVRTTIVGGRPPGSGKPLGDVPRGIEILLKKAAVDPEFCSLFLEHREEAARQIGLELEPFELAMVQTFPTEQLAAIIRQTEVPQAHRRAFLGTAAAAMVAVLSGTTALAGGPPQKIGGMGGSGGARADLPGGGTYGNRPDEPPPGLGGIRPDVPHKSLGSMGIRPDDPPQNQDAEDAEKPNETKEKTPIPLRVQIFLEQQTKIPRDKWVPTKSTKLKENAIGCSKTLLRDWARWVIFAVSRFFSPHFQEPPCRRKNITRNCPPI